MRREHGRAVDFRQTIGVRHLEALIGHRFQDRRRRRRPGGHHVDRCFRHALFFLACIDDEIQHDRRAAEMRHPVPVDRLVDIRRRDPSQAHVRAALHRDRPRVAPPAAMKHRQGPQVHRVVRQGPRHDVANRIQVRAAVMRDHAFRIAGGAGRVAQRDGLPFVLRQFPWKRRIAAGDEILVFDLADPVVAVRRFVGDVDHERFHFADFQRLAHDRREFRIRKQHLRFAVIENERDGFGIEADIDRVDHGARGRDPEQAFVERRDIRREYGDRVAEADPALAQRRGELAAACERFRPRKLAIAVDDGKLGWIHGRRAFDRAQRRQRGVVRFNLRQVLFVDVR